MPDDATTGVEPQFDDETEHGHAPPAVSGVAVLRCIGVSLSMLARRRVRQPRDRVGLVVTFADGSHGRVYRETTTGREAGKPVVLVVGFRLRWIRGRGHAAFRAESVLNTPLFIGFPGFVSKLWLENDEHGLYRGIYQWDGADEARAYARALWWVLALVSDRRSIGYRILPDRDRDDFVRGGGSESGAWWQVVDSATTGPASPSAAAVDERRRCGRGRHRRLHHSRAKFIPSSPGIQAGANPA